MNKSKLVVVVRRTSKLVIVLDHIVIGWIRSLFSSLFGSTIPLK